MLAGCAVLLAACGAPAEHRSGVAGISATLTAPSLHPPRLAGAGSIAPAPPASARPSRAPQQAAAPLRGRALPTNQWWTSALTGPWTQPLIAGPVATQVTEKGIAISYRPPVVSPDHVVQPFDAAVVAAGSLEDVRVERYGAFDVTLTSRVVGGGTVRTTLVQGSPIVYLEFSGVPTPSLALQGVPRARGASVTATVGGEAWTAAAAGGTWHTSGGSAMLRGGGRTVVVAVGPAPSGSTGGWAGTLAQAAADPVVGTTESLSYRPRDGDARQVLRVRRTRGGSGPWALTPLQHRYLARLDGRARRGSYASATGRMALVDASSITVDVPAPGFLPGVPRVHLSAVAREAVRRALAQDLAQTPSDGGSYFGAKELAREAAVAEVARAVGDMSARRRALALLRPRLEDWLTYRGPSDPHYFAYDPTWGGLIGVPAEFGAQDYNDHHLQYGYLVRAAATLAEADPAFVRRSGAVVDAVARDYADRVWDPGVEHSWASGYAQFADGNNQESSSEAVAAWSALARWGLAAGRPGLAATGLARYAFEAAAARMYWLGDGHVLPQGYRHRTVGIVWGDKIDYATWFSAQPAAIQGIQLLPAGFVGLYRWDAAGARARLAALRRAGPIRQWRNVFAAEEALFDPAGARALLRTPGPDPEPSTGRALVRYLVDTLAAGGPPDPRVSADAPYGLALRRGRTLTFLGVDPTAEPKRVTFRFRGRVLARLDIPAHGSASRTGTFRRG